MSPAIIAFCTRFTAVRKVERKDAGAAGTRPRHDRISVNTGGAPYLRRVEVLGSDDGASWAHLAAGYLIDQKSDMPFVNRTVF